MKGSCNRGDSCPFPHVSKEEADRINKAKAQAKAKAKAAPKAAVKATTATKIAAAGAD